MAGIYFHIPFCKQACHYCNFFFTTSERHRNVAIPSMKEELLLRKSYLKNSKIQTIYFGGGTPSILHPTEIQELITLVGQEFDLDENLEITLEANPDDLTHKYLQALNETDVNRFSIGIQSFFEDDLKWMNRAHNASEANDCLSRVLEYGYDNFNVDLIFGVPVSDNKKWQENLEKLWSFNPNHISCYALTVEPKTALSHMINKGKSPAPIDKQVETQFLMAHDFLSSKGYNHYEISNYALPGFKSKHNSSYWNRIDYLGIGPSAHSYNKISRSWNIAHLPQYLKAVESGQGIFETETLSKANQYNEYVMTGFRLTEGINFKDLKSSFPEFSEFFFNNLNNIPQEYLNQTETDVSLSKNGMLFADFVGSELFFIED